MRSIDGELEAIRTEAGGLLRGEDVVAFARAENTALHAKFQWDDTLAAEQYRLWQAREIIRCHVLVLDRGEDKVTTRAYVSLMGDRTEDGGGYRTMVDVMTDRSLRKKLLAQALADAERWQQKYQLLAELTPVFRQLARLRKRQEAHVD
jgi:hypothetical protein